MCEIIRRLISKEADSFQQNGSAFLVKQRWNHVFEALWLIGQKTCYKTAITIKISMVIAVLSFLKEDKGWTKNVFRMHGND